MLLPHLKPSNQRHLPYSSAYSASKRAVAPVPPSPTLTATNPTSSPRGPHSSARGDFIASALASSSPLLLALALDEPTSVLAHITVVDVVDLLDFVIEELVVI